MAKSKVNIPLENFNENLVAYNWEAGKDSTNKWAGEYWERRRKKVINALNAIDDDISQNFPKLSELASRMEKLGEVERDKEQSFLLHAFPDLDFTNFKDKDYIIKINELVNGEDQFKYALTRIRAALDNKNQIRPNGEDKKGLAPTMSSLFLSYLGTAVTERMRNLAKEFAPNVAAAEWRTRFETIIDESIDEAIQKAFIESLEKTQQDVMYGDKNQWAVLGEAYKTLDKFRKQFKNMLRTQLNLDTLKYFFDTAQGQEVLQKTRRNKIKTGGFRDKIGWTNQKFINNITGNVDEYIVTLIQESLGKNFSITEKGTMVLEGKQMKGDVVSMFSFETDIKINVEGILDMFNSISKDTHSLKQIAERLEEFYNKNLAKLENKNDFIIITNVKTAGLGVGYRDLHNGKVMPLERIIDYAPAAEMNPSLVKDFLNVAYNTLEEYGIYEDKRAEVEDKLRQIITSAAARLLFDDWSTIGVENPGAQMLHFFEVNDVIIPASILFINLGKAMAKAVDELRGSSASRWFYVRIELPKTTVYHEDDWRDSNEFGSTNEEIKMAIWQKWQEQAKKAKEESKFETRFLKNLKILLEDVITGYEF